VNLPGRHPVKHLQAFRQAVPLVRPVCLLFLGILLTVPAARAAQGEISIAEHKVLYQAWQLLDQGKPRQSLDVLDRSLSPKSAPAQWFLLRGNVLLELNRDEEARSTFSRGAQRYPEHERLQYNQAVTAYRTGRWEQAARSFVKAFELGRDPQRLYNAAAAWHQAGQNQQALQILERLLAMPLKPESVWLELGVNLCLQEQEPDRAKSLLNILVRRSPGRSQYWRLLARVHLESEDVSRSASALEIAYALQEPEPQQWIELARLYQAMNTPLAAAKTLLKAAGPEPDPDLYREIASCFARAHRLNTALTWMDKALAMEDSAGLLAEKATLLYRIGAFEQAIHSAEQALEQDDQIAGMALLIGLASCHLQAWAQAETAFARAEQIKDIKGRATAYRASLRRLLKAKPATQRPQPGTHQEWGG